MAGLGHGWHLAPLCTGSTICGVTSTINSLRLRCIGLGTEKLAQDRHIPDARHLAEQSCHPLVQQSSNAKGLPIFQFDFRFRPACRNGGNGEARNGKGIAIVQGADFREPRGDESHHSPADVAREIQLYAEGTELDGHGADGLAALKYREGKLASRQEARLLSVQAPKDSVPPGFARCSCFGGPYRRPQVNVRTEKEDVEEVREAEPRGRWDAAGGVERQGGASLCR